MAISTAANVGNRKKGLSQNLLLLIMIVLSLFISNKKLKSDKEKNTKLVEKLEKLLDTKHEE